MSVRFFGQYLIECGEIDAAQLREALNLMEQENRTLGEIAVASGFASPADVRRVNGEQRRLDLPFGEIAKRMGVLNTVEVDELLAIQHETRVQLHDAIARLELLAEDRLSQRLDDYRRDHADAPAAVDLPAPLRSHRPAGEVLSRFPRLCRRLGHVEVRVGSGQVLDARIDFPLVASIAIIGSRGLEVTLAADLLLGEKLALGLSGIGDEELARELAVDAIGEFLNILLGNTASALEVEGLESRIAQPRFGVSPTDGFAFPVGSHYGEATLVIAPR